MYFFYKSTLQVIAELLLVSSCCEGTSIRLSPLGTVSICPRGQALLTCERISGVFLYWNVSIPHLSVSSESIVANEGNISIGSLQLNGLQSIAFSITRISGNPLISELLVNNVTTEMNGSTIYCSENGNETGAPLATVNVTNKGRSLSVSLVNQLLRTDDVTVTLQWPQEAGAVYDVTVSPERLHTGGIVLTNAMTVMINLTVSYDIQYNVSIVSSVCGVTTNKALKIASCDLPTQLLHHPVFIVTGAQDNPHIEGQFITYACPPRFVLTGPNTSVCTGNGEWDPDPGYVNCIADCGVPVVNINVTLNYSSTLNGSVSTLTCENDTSIDEQVLHVTCHNNRSWIPNPAQFTCSSFTVTTVLPADTRSITHPGVILGGVLGVLIISAMAIIIAISAILCLIKKGKSTDCNCYK